ncbi:MAG: M20/M25/M40 family metallo-hydrolase [Candidatus Eiseniibacteriota bacterium]|jgi:endoglucanase
MPINRPLLEELCETAGAPGREERIRDIVRRELEPLTDEISVDAIGNVVAVRKGSKGGRFMTAGHMDEISFMVSHIHERGFLHFIPLGGFDPKTLTAQRVIVHGREDLIGVMGTKPIHIMTDEERKKPLKLEDYYIDLGLPVERVRELVRVGDIVTRERRVVQVGDMLNGKSFDNRIGVFLMIEGLRAARSSKMDIYAVGSAQEEIGIRGAMVAARNIDPQVGIALDVTLANDVPFSDAHQYVSEMGKGTAIKVYDSSVVPNWKLVEFMRETCEARGIPHQLEVMPRGGTDTAAIQRGGGGAAAGCISVPTRYVHSVIEMVHPGDVQASIDLLAALIEECEADQFAL